MASIDIEAQERKAGSIARAALRASLLNQIKNTFRKRSGTMLKTNVSAKYKQARLDRLTISAPKYSFTQHYGSSKTGTQKPTTRSASTVKSFTRHVNGSTQAVSGFNRAQTTVKGFNKNEPYTATGHLTRALNATNALETLATSLAENRIINIVSQIQI